MKQINKSIRNGIARLRLVILVVVASLTGESEVIQRRIAALTARDDMLKRKRLGGIPRGTLTILTPSLGTLFNGTTKFGPIGLTHRQGTQFPIGASVRTASRRDVRPAARALRRARHQRLPPAS